MNHGKDQAEMIRYLGTLPEGVERPVDVVPAGLQHRLWLQWCVEPLSVAALSLTAGTLLDKVVMPENEGHLTQRLLMESLNLDAMDEELAERL